MTTIIPTPPNTTSSNMKRNKKSCKYFLNSEIEVELIPGLPNDIALECLLRVPITSHPTLRLVSNEWKSIISHTDFFTLRRRNATAERLVFLVQPLPSSSPPSVQQQQVDKDGVELESAFPFLYNLGVYNIDHKKWYLAKDITIPTFAQCVALPEVGMVVILGGWDPNTLEPVPSVLVIDLASGSWRYGTQMPTARSFFACAAIGSATVCVAGGHDGQKNALRTAEMYDVETDTWQTLPHMAQERDEPYGVVFDSRFWVISGYGTESQGRFSSDAEVYDPESKTWSQIHGVWPYPGHTPKSTAVARFNQQTRWINIIGGTPKEFDFHEKSWRSINLRSIPKTITDSSSISIIDIGDDRIMVMGNGDKNGECKVNGCGGEGVYIAVKKCDGKKNAVINWDWQHVHAPPKFLGFPFSSSHLFI